MFSWFCSFHSASIAGGHSSSHRIPPVHYCFQHNSSPWPAYTTTCSAIPQLKGIPPFSSLLPLQRVQLTIFLHKSFSSWSLWGTNPAMVWLDQKAGNFLVLFVHSSKLSSRMVGSVHNSTSNFITCPPTFITLPCCHFSCSARCEVVSCFHLHFSNY